MGLPNNIAEYKQTFLTSFYYTVLFDLGVVGIFGRMEPGSLSAWVVWLALIATGCVLALSVLYQCQSAFAIQQDRETTGINTRPKPTTNILYTALQIGISAALSLVAIVVLVGLLPEPAPIPMEGRLPMNGGELTLLRIDSMPVDWIALGIAGVAVLALVFSAITVWMYRRQFKYQKHVELAQQRYSKELRGAKKWLREYHDKNKTEELWAIDALGVEEFTTQNQIFTGYFHTILDLRRAGIFKKRRIADLVNISDIALLLSISKPVNDCHTVDGPYRHPLLETWPSKQCPKNRWWIGWWSRDSGDLFEFFEKFYHDGYIEESNEERQRLCKKGETDQKPTNGEQDAGEI